MAETDWTELTDGLDINVVDRGVTNGIARPPGGGSFLFGFNSLSTAAGAVAFFTNQASFAPMAKGGSIRGVVQRGVSGGPTGFSPFLFIGAQGPSVNDNAYLLGLSDDDPHKIILKKGAMVSGSPAAATPSAGILRTSVATLAPGTFVHLRLDMVVNLNGDVLLDVFENDLSAQPLGTTPSWLPVNGMAQFIDDALGINTGSQPFTSGRSGYGFQTEDVTRRGFFDHVEVFRQL